MEPYDVEYDAIDGNIFPEEPKGRKKKAKNQKIKSKRA
jgi:hypothetical protein